MIGIKILGKDSFFEEETTLDLFWDEKPSTKESKLYSVIFGKNGSAKSSISKAFYFYLHN